MKKTLWTLFALALLVFATIQFIPSPPVVPPVTVEAAQREAHRLLAFEGIPNFRDLGGYRTQDGRQVRWGVLYRSGTLAHASRSDLAALSSLQLTTLVDFRSALEKEEEPNTLPDPVPFAIVNIPTLDEGNKAMVGELIERIETGNFDGFDPDQMMIDANRQFAVEFVPQFRQFLSTVQSNEGAPLLWHCSAGKDRTGFASAILLRILGVPQDVVMADYMASKQHAADARANQLRILRLFKGDEAADKLQTLLGVEEAWLAAAFEAIDAQWGSFENYTAQALQLSAADIESLRTTLLEVSP
jgi:protein-tyrosine phosphatase